MKTKLYYPAFIFLISLLIQSCTGNQPDTQVAQASTPGNTSLPVKKERGWLFNEEITFELRSLENSVINFNDLRKKAGTAEPYHAFADILDGHITRLESLLAADGKNELAAEITSLKQLASQLHTARHKEATETFQKVSDWLKHLHTLVVFDYE